MNDAIDPQPQPTEPSGPRGSPGWSTPSDTGISRNARVEAIFALALESASGERLDFISAACGDDIELRERVLRLLAAHDSAGTVFEEFGDAELELEFARLKPEAAGDRIGPYLLIEQIGEGGFGVVWKAEQDRPMKRKVALKIIKLGMDTRNVIARFEQERQALAFMNHPNIAKVMDAGATQQGRPYFVMELVLGAKITDYCDEIGVDIPGRLKLFMEVCRAVQHAHQKGIIHRDLKPSNILIALQDGRPAPKVIDFGVAKAVQQRLTELTIFTEVEQIIGTPLYMSPEQAEMSGVNIDTRTDIYALGVLLYELLVGRTPFDRHDLLKVGYDEMRRIIREVQPPIPSTALRILAQGEAAEIASRRQSDTRKLVHAVSGDLDCIVMKALEKECSRRYETANGLLLDVERLIRGEPISARPPSRLYRFSRTVRRNRLAFSAAALVLMSLVTGLVMTMHSRNRESIHRRLADQQRSAALASARLAERLLYASDMNAVQDALRINNLWRARMLLDEHRPRSGKEDLRAWEWRYLWQLCRSKATHTLIKQPSSVLSVTFSADSKRVAACFGDGSIKIWDVNEKKLTQEIATGLRLPVGIAGTALLTFSPIESILVLATAEGVNIYDLKTAECTPVPLGRAVSGFNFSRDGRYLICRMTTESGGKALPLDFPKLTVLDLSTRPPVANHDIPESTLTCGHGNIRFSPNGEQLYTTAREGRQLGVVAFDRRRRISNRFLPVGEDDHLLSMDLSPDGKTVAVGTGWERSEIQVWDTDRSKVKATLSRHTAYISDLVFSPTGNILGSASGDQTVRLWDTQTWLEIGVLRGHGSEVSSIAFSADGNLLASGSKDGEILLWDSNSMTQAVPRFDFPADVQWVMPVPGHSAVKVQKRGRWWIWTLPSLAEATNPADYLTALADIPTSKQQIQSRDGRWSADLLSDGFVRIKDNLEDRESILKGHLLEVNGVAFTPDARRLVTTSGGAEAAKIWDVQTGRELLNLRGRGGHLRYVYWTDDESALIVNSSTPGYAQAWIAPTWEQIASEEMVTGRWPSAQVHPSATTAKRVKSVRRTDKPIRESTGESINLAEKSLDDLTRELEDRFISSASTGSLLNTQDALFAYTVGAWQLWTGRDSDYLALSAHVLGLARVFQGTGVPSRLVRLYCLRPSSDPALLGDSVAIGRQAVSLAKGSGIPWHQLTLGMALYRRGEFDEAFEILTDAQRGAQNVPDQGAVVTTSYLIQAMCQFQLNNAEAARVYLQRGAEKMRPVPLDYENPFADGEDVNDLTAWIFYREARGLVEGEPVTSGD